MKKYFITALVFLATTAAFAQKKHSKHPKNEPAPSKDSTVVNKTLLTAAAQNPAPKPQKVWNLSKRSADHFMFQLGYDNWAGAPDSIHIQGFNRSANFYFMFDFPFKTDPRLSIGAGLGIGSSNIFFHQQQVLVAPPGGAATLGFPSSSDSYWKKYKLVTTYLEAPIELRFAVDPEHMDNSWKFAVGVKVGLMLSAYTKAKDEVNTAGQIIVNGIEKHSSKQFFNTPRLAGTVRVSKGVIGLFGQISGTTLIKSNAGPNIYPFSMGITISGL